jgi:mitochondrial chaperone BCS1
MDPSRRRGPVAGPVAAVSGFSSTVIDLPEYLVSNFMPSLQPVLQRYPFAFRIIGAFLALWYFGPITRLQSLWTRFSSLLVSSISVASDEDLFDYLVTHLAEARTLRADTSLNAMSNVPRENPRRAMREPPEESNRRATAHNEPPKLKYEQTQGTQLFIYKRRLFWAARKTGEGHTFTGNRYKTAEVISISCLGRSTKPIKDFLEHIYHLNKDKERALTIIRRPYTGGYGSRLSWSRITAKPRRALDTVILDASQKEMVIRDVEEYMDESTSAFYGRHGIPYRRGYLFHGPPGVGKTTLSLALANHFNLDVYVLTLLDQNLNDSDLISLLNQLPGRSLLLLEDIDTAGLSNRSKSKSTATGTGGGASRRGGPGRRGGGDGGPVADSVGQKKQQDDEDDEGAPMGSKVSLSGLLNAIDGVAAPEGHILIMTSNQPHELDDALVRAGRISVRVKFENASRGQAREIFKRMYCDPADGRESEDGLGSVELGVEEKRGGEKKGQKEEEVDGLAERFAGNLPEGEFSPADLQDYLLMHKKNPARAVEGMDDWVERTREEKSKKEEEREIERAVRRERKKREEEDFKEVVRGLVRDEKDEKEKGKEGGEGGGGEGSGKAEE